MMISKTVIFVFCLMYTGNCKEQPKGNGISSVTSRMRIFNELYHDQNPEGVAEETYMPDAYILPPDEPIGKGRDAVANVYGRYMAAGARDVIGYKQQAEAFADVVIEVYTNEADTANAKVIATGRGIVVWVRDPADGKWRFIADIWSFF